MDIDSLNLLDTSLRTLKLSRVEKFVDSFQCTGDMIFASFYIYDNAHSLRMELMKGIAMYARSSLDISKPICLHGFRFSRVTQKTEWMNRTLSNINLPSYPGSVEDLL